MEKQKKQRRVSFSDVADERYEGYSKHGDVRKSGSFRDEGVTKLRGEYNVKESEFAASIAAAAYAIYSLEETRAEFEKRMRESFREDPSAKIENIWQDDQQKTFEPQEQSPRVQRRSSDGSGGGSSLLRTATRSIEISAGLQQRGTGMTETKAEAWERARIAKINKWYEKMNRKIMEWENEKKKRAALVMDTRKAEIERLKRLNLHHYQNKVDRIEDVAEGARKQLEEKKRSEEAYAKDKAKKIRATGRVPVQCLCFEY